MSEGICSTGVIVGTDGSPSATAAVGWAVAEARMRRVALGVVHVAAGDTATDRDADDILTDAVSTASAEPAGEDIEIGSSRLAGDPVSTLADLSRTAAMIVLGRHGDTTRMHRLLGSVSTGVLHHARCPVAVVHVDPTVSARTRRQPVLVGVDGSRCSALAAEIAFDEASWRGVDVVALYVCDGGGGPSANRAEAAALQAEAEYRLDTALAPLGERHRGVAVHRLIRFESPARQLLIQGERAQLVVVGSHGRGALAGVLLGSVSTAVAREVRAPVIVARRS
ncbi:universal stress protein [Mycolicibacterium psychrotolerans]|uniref:Universal stress protein UspA n=1 Tax=Mycolicibacterium psychrotolerans TaxID=216929 RepID=A0A7I7MHP1_9MYCO|nr:universal stress protein [Mycolicibacterium psychrotolerans]BBX71854.1 universal stress protein UspA [Mycolicibacterium psychrotolerans]